MKTPSKNRIRPFVVAVAAVLFAAVIAESAQASNTRGYGRWLAGAWYLALDTTAFGLPPGVPLGGIAVFDRYGTYQIQDAGDFGQATFLNTRHSYQFGAWERVDHGVVLGTALFLEAELSTGELLRWQKVRLELHKTDDRDVVTGTANISVLECANMLPLPTALTCPDPIAASEDFVPLPPFDIPVTLKRIRAGD